MFRRPNMFAKTRRFVFSEGRFVSPRSLGNCLFPIRKLLTRGFDSNSFRLGVTTELRKHDRNALRRPLCRTRHQGRVGEEDYGVGSFSYPQAFVRRTDPPPGCEPAPRHQQRSAVRSIPSRFYWATTAN